MSAQTTRLRVIAENIANSATTGSTPGSDPYRRKTVVFSNTLDETLECLKTDGTIGKLHEKWFGIAAPAGSAALTPFPGHGVPGL